MSGEEEEQQRRRRFGLLPVVLFLLVIFGTHEVRFGRKLEAFFQSSHTSSSLRTAAATQTSLDTFHQPVWKTQAKVCNNDEVLKRRKEIDGNNNDERASSEADDNDDDEIPSRFYKAQSDEDEELEKWFDGLCDGSYLEMGALDGVTFSNSYLFNKAGLNWKGVLIEASARNYQNLVKNRPDEIALVHAAVCEEARDLHWVDAVGKNKAVGGFLEFASDSFKRQWWTEELISKAEVVKCRPLNDILMDVVSDGFFFDFFSLDVEGAELEVLRSVDYTKVGFGIILIEFDKHNEMKNLAIRSLLESNGYVFLSKTKRSGWFANRDFEKIYKDLVYARDV